MNMIDYCIWRGDLSFRKDPFNEVDNLLLSQISYLTIDELIASGDRKTIKELAQLCLDNNGKSRKGNRLISDSILVLKAMANTRRFSGCVVHHYRSCLYKDSVEQFAAMMIDLPDHTTVVSFRGTDDSLVGWKEDLMLSYQNVNAQKDALTYVEEYCNQQFRKYRFIGHSKGGNLALFAGTNCNKKLQKRIIQIISNDGPGLMNGTYSIKDFEAIKKRYTLLVPERDGVGTIYEMAADKKMILSSANNIVSAHSMLTWMVERNHLVTTDKESRETDLSRKIIHQILEETDEKEREIFVNEVFYCLEQYEIHTIYQLSEGGLPLMIKILRSLTEMDSIAKNTAMKILMTISENIGSDLYQNIYTKAGNIKRKTYNLSENIDTLINEYKMEFKKKK